MKGFFKKGLQPTRRTDTIRCGARNGAQWTKMEDTSQGARPPEAPRGMYTCKLDDRSRLKLPADWVTFFNSLAEKTLFITSLDRHVAQIYPMSVWRDNEKLLDNFT